MEGPETMQGCFRAEVCSPTPAAFFSRSLVHPASSAPFFNLLVGSPLHSIQLELTLSSLAAVCLEEAGPRGIFRRRQLAWAGGGNPGEPCLRGTVSFIQGGGALRPRPAPGAVLCTPGSHGKPALPASFLLALDSEETT